MNQISRAAILLASAVAALTLGACSTTAPTTPAAPSTSGTSVTVEEVPTTPSSAPSTTSTTATDAASTSDGSMPFPTSGPVPPSIGNDVIGGAMCAAANAWWVDTGGHPEVHVFAPAVAEVSVSFLGTAGELLGTDQAGQISVGRGGIQLVGTDVRSVDVKAVSLAIAGSQLGDCVVPKA